MIKEKAISKTTSLIEECMIAAIYAILTLTIRPIGPTLQIRISELLVILIIFNKRHIYGLTLGCFIANLYSEFAYMDVPFGTLATYVSTLWMIYFPNRYYLNLIYPVVINAVAVGLMLSIFFKEPLLLMILSVATTEFITLFIIGIPVIHILKKIKIVNYYLSR